MKNVPYLDWITSNLKLFEYQSDYAYNLDDFVTIGSDVYQSLISNNLNNYPVNSNYWIKVL